MYFYLKLRPFKPSTGWKSSFKWPFSTFTTGNCDRVTIKRMKMVDSITIERFLSSSNCKYYATGAAATEDSFSTSDKRQQIIPFEKMPAAKRLPFIATKLDFFLSGSGKKLHQYIDKRHKQLGPIFREPLGPIDGVFISSAEFMREVFLYEGKYPKHPLPDAWVLYNDIHKCKRGLFFMKDEEWLINRKIMNTLLLRNNDFPSAQEAIKKNCAKLVDEWSEIACSNSQQFTEIPDLIKSLYKWSINVIIDVLLGNTSIPPESKLNSLIDNFTKNVHKIFEFSAPLMSISPSLAQKLNLSIWSNFERSVSLTLDIANSIIDEAFSDERFHTESCLIFKMKSLGMSIETIKRIFVDLLIAAGDTTAFSTQWALYLLAKDENVQHQVRNEIMENPHNFECSLVKGSVREALRLYPVATFIGRIFETDAIIGNYEIRQYTPVLLSMYTSGRDNRHFPEAEKFVPARWNRQSNGLLQYVKYSHGTLPYALGSRSCIGQKVANLQMHYILTDILKNFEMKLLNENKIDIIMKMVAVPSENVRIGLKKI